MSRRSGIPQAFTARLEEKKRKAREDFHDESKNDFLAFDVDSSNAEPPISDNNSTVPVEYAAKLMGATILPIGGIEVQFPFKPYPAQIQMMSKVIEAVSRSQDALIESPTGSGKSLALLCASLAWQKHDQISRTDSGTNTPTQSGDEKDEIQILTKEQANKVWSADTVSKEVESATQQEFQPLIASRIQRKRRRYYEKVDPHIKENVPEPKPQEIMEPKAYTLTPKATRIYYASRTHKQISQVVAELKSKTPYRPRMTILGSRDQLCIHPKVSKSVNKNEECSILRDEHRCSYGNGVRKMVSHSSIQRSGNNFIWDIEDLTKLGRKSHACPYYTSKTLLEVAEIVFCPYNYLIEPLIREAYDINLKDCVVIIDEAHNIEDAAREAASFAIHEKELLGIQKELNIVIKYGALVEQHRKLLYVVESLMNWIVDPNNNFSPLEYEHYINSWTGAQIVNKLTGLGINRITMANDLMPALAQVISAVSQMRKDKSSHTEMEHLVEIGYEENDEMYGDGSSDGKKGKKYLGARHLTLLQGLFVVFANLFKEDGDNAGDYIMVLMKRAHKNRMSFSKDADWEFKLSFWCHNAGIAFKDITEKARSVILSSGTLSPMNTFASELHTDFPIRLETNHVIDKSQIWAGVVPHGPDKVNLTGSFKTMDTFVYQDDIGNGKAKDMDFEDVHDVLHITNARIISPSAYSSNRTKWNPLLRPFIFCAEQRTGLLAQLSAAKLVITEPKSVSKAVFDKELARFYANVNANTGTQTGALLIAVYRGKVSEGIDFSDARCRAVISIGIPFPSLKDFQVISKRDYNSNARRMGKNILSGDEWYTVQAHRAVNQALGRCIRHRKDWGAIILLEYRFLQPENTNALSKWIRAQCKKHTGGFADAMSDLADFVKMRVQADDVEMADYVEQSESREDELREQVVYVAGETYIETEESNMQVESVKNKENDRQYSNIPDTNQAEYSLVDILGSILNSHSATVLDERPLQQYSNSIIEEADAEERPGKIHYNITCRQCKVELGYCVEDESFVVQRKSVPNQYFEEIRQPHLPDSPCFIYELLPHQNWNSNIFRTEQFTTLTVRWNQLDKICYQEIHCPTCQTSVPNGLGLSIIGARIAVCQSDSPKEITDLLGRVWLLQEAVKIDRSVQSSASICEKSR